MTVPFFNQHYQSLRNRNSNWQDFTACPQCGQPQTGADNGCLICSHQAQNSIPEHQPADRLIAGVIALTLSFLTALVFSILPVGADPHLWSAVVVMAFAAAIGIAEAILRGIDERRFRSLAPIVVGCFVLAVLFVLPISLLTQGLNGLVMPGCLLIIGAPTILVWLR